MVPPSPDSGLFGLTCDPLHSRFAVFGVPVDATTSYRDGTRRGRPPCSPPAVRWTCTTLTSATPGSRASSCFPSTPGPSHRIARLNADARRYCRPIIEAGGASTAGQRRSLEAANRHCGEIQDVVHRAVEEILERGQRPFLVGGDHSSPFGGIRAVLARHPGLGILHVDAHADLREAYEGFTWSHASIMDNVLTRLGGEGGVARLIQVGVRDLGAAEAARIESEGEVIRAHFDRDLKLALMNGTRWPNLCDRIVADLPPDVWVSIDIDGLDPKLCPDTGTPVPGGLEFEELIELLRALVRAGRRIVGGDVCEVAPDRRLESDDLGGDWNANVGSRVLYKLWGRRPRRVERRAGEPARRQLVGSVLSDLGVLDHVTADPLRQHLLGNGAELDLEVDVPRATGDRVLGTGSGVILTCCSFSWASFFSENFTPLTAWSTSPSANPDASAGLPGTTRVTVIVPSSGLVELDADPASVLEVSGHLVQALLGRGLALVPSGEGGAGHEQHGESGSQVMSLHERTSVVFWKLLSEGTAADA